MVKYGCEKCGKEFSQKGHYTKHLNKKNPCIIESKVKEMLENPERMIFGSKDPLEVLLGI